MADPVAPSGRSFADILRRYRSRAGLTQEELAEAAGLSVRGVRYLEKGLRHPTRDTVHRLTAALALPAADQNALVRAARPGRGGSEAALGVRRGEPPRSPGPLIGREKELAVLVDILSAGDVGILTLTGPGGVGKTRLALEAARTLGAGFCDGVVWVALATVADPAHLPAAIAGALELTADGPRADLHVLACALAERRMLLVLDDFEGLAEAAATVAELANRCPRLVVLVTSRVSLRLRVGREFAVGPLAIPAPGASASIQALAANPAVELFMRRAQATTTDLALTRYNADTVADICRRLEGLPLALELAAARTSVLPPAALLARLQHRLGVLTGAARDAPQRQRTMREAISWSHDLLSASGQALFRRLGVFEGGCSLSAIEAVCRPDAREPADLLDDVEELQRASLLRLEDGDDEDPRFRMLDTVREYAQERLEASGETDSLQERHNSHYLALAEDASCRVFGPHMARALDELEREHANLAAALRSLTLKPDAVRALRLSAALWPYWYVRGHATEGRASLAAVLRLPGSDRVTTARAQALLGSGQLAVSQGDYAAARDRAADSVTVCRALGDDRGLAEALLVAGFAARLQEDHPADSRLLTEALAAARAADHPFMAAAALHHLGLMAADVDRDTDAAQRLLRESLETYRTLGLTRFSALLHLALGDLALSRGDLPQARSLLSDSLRLMTEVKERIGVQSALDSVARLALHEGEARQAVRLAGAAARLRTLHGTTEWPAVARRRGAWLALAQKTLSPALFTVAWEEGEAMTQDRAVAVALDQLRPCASVLR
jgi:predicted ATPase/transcriptional regulator with XRE-family HTH domain